jgi:hemolysin type calcium-binding protein
MQANTNRRMNYRRARRVGALCAVAAFGVMGTSYAALQDGTNAKKPQVLIGADNDNIGDPTIQPIPTPPGADQSLKKSDQITGGAGSDLLIGRLGADVLDAGAGDDVIVGGTEGGQAAPPLPNNDIAYGRTGSDTFVWTAGDGSDAFIGGDAVKPKGGKAISKTGKKGHGRSATVARKHGKKKKAKKPAPEVDTLVLGNQLLTDDISLPQTFPTKFGYLPKVFSSDRGVPTPVGGNPPRNPNTTGFCEIVPAPAGLGYEFLVRFFAAPGNLAVTIRTKGVEQVICPTQGTDGATLTSLGKNGAGPASTQTADFHAAAGSKLAAFVF